MLPAYAGMIRGWALTGWCWTRAPRVCGDDPRLSIAKDDRKNVLPAYAGMIL